MNGRWLEERGSTSALLLSVWSVALIAIALAIDLGRLFVIREQLRTAEEAAALAGVLQAQYMVEARFPRRQNQPYQVCEPIGPEGIEVKCHLVDNWVPIAPAVIAGPESEVWPEAHKVWAQQCYGYDIRCDRQYEASACWIAPRKSWAEVRSAALEAFALNERWGDQASLAGAVDVAVETGNKVRPRQLKVGVTATLEMKTLLFHILGVDSIPVSTQGSPTAADLVRRSETGLTVWIDGALVKSPCLL